MSSLLRFTSCCILLALFAVALGMQMPAQAQASTDEDALIAVLTSEAPWLEKQDACRQLRRIGTAKSIPALASLLGEEKLSHLARYALEPMPYPAVDDALRAALTTVTDTCLAGIATSLGVRRDEQAVAALVGLMGHEDPAIANAAAGALGRIGNVESASSLLAADRSDPARAIAIDEATLAAGGCLIAEDELEAAQRVFATLLDDKTRPQHIRLGAFRGLAFAVPGERPQELMQALSTGDPIFRDLAAHLVAETRGDGYTAFYADRLNSLPDAGQVALLRALATRGDPLAREAVVRAVETGSPEVRLAALKALEHLGTVEDVSRLAKLASGDDATATAAHATLVGMEAEGINEAMAQLAGEAEPGLKSMLIDLLVVRGSEAAVPSAMARLADSDASVRLAALQAISSLGDAEQVPALIAILEGSAESAEKTAAARALNTICAREGDTILPVVLAAMESASPKVKIALIDTLQRIGGPEALSVILAKADDADETIAAAATEVLMDWPTVDAAPHLMAYVEQGDPTWRDQALRAYVRLAKANESLPEKTAMLETATKQCVSKADKWLVLAAWGTLPTPRSVNELRPHLDDPEVRDEAASAIIAIARPLSRQGAAGKALMTEALQEVIQKCESEAIQGRARRALDRLG